MKKFIKILFFTFISLLAVLLMTVSAIVFLAFSPERFTPIVRKQAGKFITCQSEIGEVELTFFSTFPDFGLKLKQFALINPVEGSQSDTLVKVDELVGVIDAVAWWKKDELIIKGLEVTDGYFNVFSDSLGNTNYDIFSADTSSSSGTESETTTPAVDIKNIDLNNISLSYKDLSSKLNAVITDLSAEISGIFTNDSLSSNIKVKRSVVSLEYAGEKYLSSASISLDIPSDMILSRQFIRLNDARISVNDLELLLNGSLENDTVNHKIITDITYQFASWPVENIIALIPSSFNSYIRGIEASGLLSAQGKINGFVADSVMPLMEIQLQMQKGALKYTGFPLPLNDIEGDITLQTDLKTDSVSYVRIKQFRARTPLSTIETAGQVNHLFGDIFCDLSTTAGLTLDEFNQVIPDSMKISLKGKVTGRIRSSFSLSQLEKMQLERMRLSGSVALSGFSAVYDSISATTDMSKIDFSLPGSRPSTNKTRFASATIRTGNLSAAKLDSYGASLKNAFFTIETSDIRDTARIPDLICSYQMDSLSAEMDSISVKISKPNGKVSLSPRYDGPDQPRILLAYNSGQVKAGFGQSTFEAEKINLDTDILNDNSQKDIFLQWNAKGFIDMIKGNVKMAGLSHPVEIPSVKMNFEPETFNIRESLVKIDRSDFRLSGNLRNILSYFKGDSILRGNFSFVSNTTDISQLMALTSGIGYKDSTATATNDVQETDTTYAGPYMVPRRMDLVLSVNIEKATMGVDTATNITGNVLVKDGILVLDGLSLKTPAARIQLTTMYRTPRRNHLFLGLDYHMLDIEISELLKMIPDIDTLMPMLRSFSGKAEFHIAAETYMDSLYNLKKSTLRGASSIKGNNLVLMDGETFSEIAKTLRFSKKTENKVDSLSAEFTIFRNEIDIYPFLIVMDKYKAVVAGRHNFDLTYDYHISVVDCPIPIKLGVDIKGTKDAMSYSLAKCRYAEYYRPTSRRAVENKQLELRKLIRETLTQKVKD